MPGHPSLLLAGFENKEKDHPPSEGGLFTRLPSRAYPAAMREPMPATVHEAPIAHKP